MHGKDLLEFLLRLSDKERKQYEFVDLLNIYRVRESVYRAGVIAGLGHVCYEEIIKIADAIYPKVREQLISEMINGYSDIYNDMDITHRQHIDDVVEEQVIHYIKGNVHEVEEKTNNKTVSDRIRTLSDEDLAKLFVCKVLGNGMYYSHLTSIFYDTEAESFEATLEELKKELKDEISDKCRKIW